MAVLKRVCRFIDEQAEESLPIDLYKWPVGVDGGELAAFR